MEKFINKAKIIFSFFVLEQGEEEAPVHPLAQPLIHEFGDVFPTNLPLGLPLIRAIELGKLKRK